MSGKPASVSHHERLMEELQADPAFAREYLAAALAEAGAQVAQRRHQPEQLQAVPGLLGEAQARIVEQRRLVQRQMLQIDMVSSQIDTNTAGD